MAANVRKKWEANDVRVSNARKRVAKVIVVRAWGFGVSDLRVVTICRFRNERTSVKTIKPHVYRVTLIRPTNLNSSRRLRDIRGQSVVESFSERRMGRRVSASSGTTDLRIRQPLKSRRLSSAIIVREQWLYIPRDIAREDRRHDCPGDTV